MIRWEPSDPRRLNTQEKALLALCDRVQVLEQLLTLATDSQRQMLTEALEQRRVVKELKDRVLGLEARLKEWE